MPATHSDSTGRAAVWLEALALAAGIACYLFALQADAPNGDGRVYMRQIESGAVVWNPNHLLMQPAGAWLARAAGMLCPGATLFAVLKLISGASAVLSIVLFHRVLLALDVRSGAVRILAALGLFFSAHFVSMAIAEEFYMLQMPFLAAVLLMAARWTRRCEPHALGLLAGAGVMLGLATTISINNLTVLLTMGLAVGLAETDSADRWSRARRVVWLCGPAASVALAVYLAAYLAASPDRGFVSWMTAYQGQSGNALGRLYGLEATPRGVVVSLATLGYGFVSSLSPLGDLGVAAESLVRGRPLEFQPDVVLLGATSLVFAAATLLAVPLACWAARRVWRDAWLVVATAWIAGYLAFNFLWVDTSDQFWFQILPALWTLLAFFFQEHAGAALGRQAQDHPLLIAVVAGLLAVVNTGATVAPRAFTRSDRSGRRWRGCCGPATC